MLFTENRYDRSMEKMMKGIPNFHPRGSGIVVTGNFRYTAEMCDCEDCGYNKGRSKTKKHVSLLPFYPEFSLELWYIVVLEKAGDNNDKQ